MQRECLKIEKTVMAVREALPQLGFMPEKNRKEIEDIIKKIKEDQQKADAELKKLEEKVEEIKRDWGTSKEKDYHFKRTGKETAEETASLEAEKKRLEADFVLEVEKVKKRKLLIEDYKRQLKEGIDEESKKIVVADDDVKTERPTDYAALLATKIAGAQAQRDRARAKWKIDKKAFDDTAVAAPPAGGKKGKGGAGPADPGPEPAIWNPAIDNVRIEGDLFKAIEFIQLTEEIILAKAKEVVYVKFLSELDATDPVVGEVDKAILEDLEAKRKEVATRDKLHKTDISGGDYNVGAPRNRKNIELIDGVFTELSEEPQPSPELIAARAGTALPEVKGEGEELDFEAEKDKLLAENDAIIAELEKKITDHPHDLVYPRLLLLAKNVKRINLLGFTAFCSLVNWS